MAGEWILPVSRHKEAYDRYKTIFVIADVIIIIIIISSSSSSTTDGIVREKFLVLSNSPAGNDIQNDKGNVPLTIA